MSKATAVATTLGLVGFFGSAYLYGYVLGTVVGKAANAVARKFC